MGNAVAYVVLFSWPVAAILLFRSLPTHRALIWTILGGYLLLPVGTQVNLPMIPAFAALLLCLTRLRGPGELLPRGRLARLLTVVFLLCPFATVATNGDPVIFGPRVLPGQELYDAFSFAATHAVMIIPFLLGQRFLADERALRDLLTAVAVAGLVYSLPALFEVRMSPQLHTWIYGYFPHSFAQQMRFDGFRPVVFLGHGLLTGLFFAMAFLAAAALWRGHRGSAKGRWAAAAGWLLLTLALAKAVSAWAYAALLAPVLFAGRRLQRLVLLAVGLTVLFYPMLRGADLVPTRQIEAAAVTISQDRADSLRYRFDNEDILLTRANERPLFGWGGWGRNRVHDPETGHDISVTDGWWIIVIGQYGWIGYVAEFGLLTLPLLLLARRRIGGPAPFAAVALGLILAANLIDLLPNSGITPLTWLIAGGLTGLLARAPARARNRSPVRPEGAATARESTP